MEHISLTLNDEEIYKELVHGSLPQFGSTLELATLDNGTESGKAVAVISFMSAVADGSVRVQAVTTVSGLIQILEFLKLRYDADGNAYSPLGQGS